MGSGPCRTTQGRPRGWGGRPAPPTHPAGGVAVSLTSGLVPAAALRRRGLQLPGAASGGRVQCLPVRGPRPAAPPGPPQPPVLGRAPLEARPLPAAPGRAPSAAAAAGEPGGPVPRPPGRELLGPPQHGVVLAGPEPQLCVLKPQAAYGCVSSLFIGLFMLFIFLLFLLGIIKSLKERPE